MRCTRRLLAHFAPFNIGGRCVRLWRVQENNDRRLIAHRTWTVVVKVCGCRPWGTATTPSVGRRRQTCNARSRGRESTRPQRALWRFDAWCRPGRSCEQWPVASMVDDNRSDWGDGRPTGVCWPTSVACMIGADFQHFGKRRCGWPEAGSTHGRCCFGPVLWAS
jgi:hypothetical protein